MYCLSNITTLVTRLSLRWGLLYSFILLQLVLHAQMLQVCEQKTQFPLPYATFYANDIAISRLCNTQGQVDIADFSSSKSITVSMLGFDERHLSYDELAQLDTLFLYKKSIVLSTVEVATLRQSLLSDYQVVQIERLNAEDLVFFQTQTSADLLGLSDDVFIQKSQQGGGSPMIRGFAANRLLYTVDGVRMNTAIFRSGNLQNVIALDANAMASANILLGANSVIYGSDAIGGVMAFETKAPALNDGKNFALQFNTAAATANRYSSQHLDLSYGNAVLSGLTSLSYQKYGQVKMGRYGPDDYLQKRYVVHMNGHDFVFENSDPEVQRPNDFSQVNLMQKIYYTPNENWQIDYALHYSTSTEYDRYDRLLQYKNHMPRYAVWKYGPQRWLMNHLNVRYSTSHLFYDRIELKLAYQHFEESRISRNFNDVLQQERVENVDAYSFNLDLSKRFNRHHLYYGLEGVLDQVHSKAWQSDVSTHQVTLAAPRYPQALWSSYAFFVHDVFQIHPLLSLNVGARYNLNVLDAHFDTTFYDFPFTDASQLNHALTWHTGLSFQPTDDQVYKAIVSTAFRAPNVDDMGKVFDSEPGTVIVPNVDLKPEKAYNFELRAKRQWTKASIETSLYYTRLQQAFIRQSYRFNGQDSLLYDGQMSEVFALQNAAHAYVYGASLLGDVALPYALSLAASYHYQYGQEVGDDGEVSYARHVAPNFARLSLRYHYEGLEAQLYGLFHSAIPYSRLAQSERAKPHLYALDEDGNPYAPAWYTLNLKCAYHFSPMFQINLGIENMTNQRYRPYSSGLTAVGRNVTMSLQLNM